MTQNKTITDYEVRCDKMDDGTPVWDVYEHYEGDSEYLETFYSREEAEKYAIDASRKAGLLLDITKWTEILSAKDVAKEQKYAAKIRWAFSAKSLNAQIDRFEAGDDKEKCKVYFLLEDCNFHEVAGLLANYDVAGARKWAKDNL